MKNFLLIVSLIVISSCSSLEMVSVSSQKPVSFSKLPMTPIGKIDTIVYDCIFFWGLINYDKDIIDKAITKELKKFPKAKGIMNLKIRSYNSFNTSITYASPIGLIIGFYSIIIGTSYRNTWITGEVY